MKNFIPVPLLLLLILFGCGEQRVVEESEAGQPNILFLIADDWSFPHAGVYGDRVVRTPTFDRLAAEGALFNHAYTASPSCSPSRAAILTGRYPHQLESAGNLWSVIPAKFPNWVSLLAEQGYATGMTRKGWAPGDYKSGGYSDNPAGIRYDNFRQFFEEKPKDKPFTFWFGSSDPHRAYEANTGLQAGMSLEEVIVPGFLPDLTCVRNDILDYYFEVERFDRECGQILNMLEEAGELDNTIVVMTSDNGMPFPRAKANLYDYGTRMPLVIRWPKRVQAGTVIDHFVNFVDFAPTFLEAAGLEGHPDMSGESLWPLFSDSNPPRREMVFLERERHANVRKGDLSYPMRGLRNEQYLYIRNLMPERWPAGDPEVHRSVGQWGDVDNSITKFLIMNMEGRNDPNYFDLTFGHRPAEELYDVMADPFQLTNLSENPGHQSVLEQMRTNLNDWMVDSGDPRATDPRSIYWDTVRYVPVYQHENVNLSEELAAYRMIGPFGGEGENCLNRAK